MIVLQANQRAVTGGMGDDLPITRSAAVGGKHCTQFFSGTTRKVPLSSASANPTGASWRRCSDTVGWTTGSAATISLNVIGVPLRAISETT